MITRLLINSKGLNSYQRHNIRIVFWAILFTTFSGALRKWVFDAAFIGNLILLFQLVLPLAIVFLFKGIKFGRNSSTILFVYAISLFLMALNPLNHTFYHGLLGLVLHLGFWVPVFIYIENKLLFPVEHLKQLLVILFLTQFVLGVLQYQLPGDHILNIYAQDKAVNRASVGGGTRVSGTFSFLSGYTAFLAMGGFFVWAFSLQYRRNYLLHFLFAMGLLLSSLMSGSRASLILSITLIIWSIFPTIKKSILKTGLFKALVIGVAGILIASNFRFFQLTLENFLVRINRGVELNEYENRTYGIFEEVVNYRGSFPLTGVGLGATYQGANAIWGESRYTKNYEGGYEEEPERIILEGGFILLFAKFFLFWYIGKRLKIPKIYWAILFVYQFIGFPLVFNTYNTFYFYVGLMLVDRAYLNLSRRQIDNWHEDTSPNSFV